MRFRPVVSLRTWIAAGIGLAVLLFTGICILFTPAHEVLYTGYGRSVSTNARGSLCFYSIDLGNTGRKPQSEVRLFFLQQAITNTILDPSFRNYGVTDRPASVQRSNDVAIYSLGRIEPEKIVSVQLTINYPPGVPPRAWDEILLRVEPAEGAARIGSPSLTMFARVMNSIFGF